MLKHHILCVTDQESTHKQIQKILRPFFGKWNISYAHNLRSALTWFENEAFDLVVADSRMKSNEGILLLNGIMRSSPNTNRIAITDEHSEQYIKNTVELVHQSLRIEDLDDKLLCIIHQAYKLSDICDSPELLEAIDNIEIIPSLPSIYNEMLQVLNDEDSSIHDVGRLISKDIAMTAKILQLVNSAFFGLCRRIRTAEEAAVYIGVDTLKSLVLSYQAFAALSVESIPQKYIDELWKHSVTTASFAKSIAQCETKNKIEINTAFTAGMLHDIGRLLLMDNLPDKYNELLKCLQKDDVPELRLEQLIFGATHPEVGAYLLRKWGLPNAIVEPILMHHSTPLNSPQTDLFSPSLAVSAADALYYELLQPEIQESDRDIHEDQKSNKWRLACNSVLQGEST